MGKYYATKYTDRIVVRRSGELDGNAWKRTADGTFWHCVSYGDTWIACNWWCIPMDAQSEFVKAMNADGDSTVISMDKKYKTAGGSDVRILCVDAPGELCVVGMYLPGGTLERWKANGECELATDDRRSRLVEVREKRRLSGHMNVYSDGVASYHRGGRGVADFHVDQPPVTKRIACIDLSRFEFEVGEGLE